MIPTHHGRFARDYSFTFSERFTLRVDSHRGDVTVRHDAPEGEGWLQVTGPADIDAEPIEFTTTESEARLVVPPLLRTESGRGIAFKMGSIEFALGGAVASVDIEAHVPPGADVELNLHSGDATITGDTDALDVRSRSGDIQAERARVVQLESGSGDIALGSVDEGGAIATASGDVRVARVAGPTQLRTGSGDLQLGDVSADLTFGSGSGDVNIELLRSGTVTGKTGSGDVRVVVAPGVPVWQDLVTGTGDVNARIESAGEPAPGQEFITLRLQTGSGDIDALTGALR